MFAGKTNFGILPETHRAAVLDDGVAQPVGALCSQVLAVGASEDERFFQIPTRLLVLVGHAVPAVVGDVLVRLFGQKLQQLQLNRHRVWLLLLVPVAELKSGVI